MKDDRQGFDPDDGSTAEMMDRVANMTPEEINRAIDAEGAGEPDGGDVVQEAAGGSLSDDLDLSDVVSDLTGKSPPAPEEAAEKPDPEPEPKPEPKEPPVNEEMARLQEELRHEREQREALMLRLLGDQGAPKDEDGDDLTLDDLDEHTKKGHKPLYQPGIEAKQEVEALKREIAELAPIREEMRQRAFSDHLSKNVEGFKPEMMNDFMSWIGKQPDDIQETYGRQGGVIGAEALAQRFVRSRKATSPAQQRTHPLASQAAPDMGGESQQRVDRKPQSYDDLMGMSDEAFHKLEAQVEDGF